MSELFPPGVAGSAAAGEHLLFGGTTYSQGLIAQLLEVQALQPFACATSGFLQFYAVGGGGGRGGVSMMLVRHRQACIVSGHACPPPLQAAANRMKTNNSIRNIDQKHWRKIKD